MANTDTVMLTVRLPRGLRDDFLAAAKGDDLTASQILRRAIRGYLGSAPNASASTTPSVRGAGSCAPPQAETVEESPVAEPEGDALMDFIGGIAEMLDMKKG